MTLRARAIAGIPAIAGLDLLCAWVYTVHKGCSLVAGPQAHQVQGDAAQVHGLGDGAGADVGGPVVVRRVRQVSSQILQGALARRLR